MFKFFITTVFFVVGMSESLASDSINFKLKALVRNGELLKAEEILKKSEDKIGKDSEIYNRIYGQILTKKEMYLKANVFLEKAYELDSKEQTLFLMAQNTLKLKNPKKTVSLLNNSKKDSVPIRLMLSQAYWDLGEKFKALKVIQKKGFKENELLEKQRYNFLIKLSMVKSLFERVGVYLELYPEKVEPAIFATVLLKEKDQFLSEKLFDLAIAKSPKSALLLKEKGAFELELGRSKVASHYFSRAAHLNLEYSFEASVTKLLLGEHHEALFFARNISDPSKRLKQIFFIYLDQERFDEIVSMKEQLVRLNLFRQEKITYAFLYSAFKVKDVESFNKVFSNYQIKSQLSNVMKLKELLEKCNKTLGLECVFS